MLLVSCRSLQQRLGLLGLFLLFGMVLWGQTRVITGTVTDAETGEPLIGANVTLAEDMGTGTITDIDGNYSLEVPATTTQLRFSYTGYSTVVLDITGDRLDVALSSGEVLEEVVVIGYGTQRKKEITGSVTNISAEDFNRGNVNDPAQLLQGKVAGLSIARPGADPNGGFQIRLRGLSTFGANTSPLIVIDGVIGASLETVDPNDIETIDILKDASAAAIYGTRGASGVILITTKQGREGTTKVDYTGFVSMDQVANKVDVLTADEYRTLPRTTDFGANTDWIDEMTRDAVTHVHSLSLSGGSSRTNYRVSLNYRDGQGIAMNTGFDQINGRINLMQKAFDDRLTLNFNLSSTIRNEDPGFSEAFGFAIRYNPTAPVTEPDNPDNEKWGSFFQRDAFGFFNPVAVLEQNINERLEKRFLGNVRADYELIPGWKVGLFYNQTRDNDFQGLYFSKQSFWTPFGTRNDRGFATRRNDERFSQLFETTSTYETNFGKLNLKALGGYSYQEFVNEGFGVTAGGYLTDGFGFNNLGAAADIQEGRADVYSYKNKNKLVAFFGRLNFNFDDRFFLMASIRREGSTKFGENNKWGWFPGVSAGVDVSEFIDADWVTSLKLRAGFGITGNTPAGTNLSLLRFGPQGSQFYSAGEYVQAFGPVSNPNPDLKWETKSDLNLGVDFVLFDYKLNGSIEYYQTKTSDLILDFPVRVPPNLYETSFLNLGEMENSGVELTLNAYPVETPNFSWEPSIAFTRFFDANLLKISGEQVESEGFRLLGELGAPFLTGVQTVRIEENAPIGQIIGPRFIGIDDNGVMQYEDIDGDGRFRANNDVAVIGHGLPKYQIGFNNSFRYKNWDFNFFIRGVFGHDLLNVNNARYGVPASIAIQSGMGQALDFLEATNGPVYSDVHVEDADFIRLDNATIGYNFDLGGSNAFNRLRLYVTGQNLLTITDYTGVDPEVRFTDGGNPLAPGIDRENTYFFARSIVFGVNLGF